MTFKGEFKRWAPFFLRGLMIFPAYLRFWGWRRSFRRLLKSAVFPGITQISLDLIEFRALRFGTGPDVNPLTTLGDAALEPDYVIVAPNFTGNSAGVGCLYKLAHDLRQLGFEAVITGSQVGHSHYPTTILPNHLAKRAARRGAWVIYPETIYGNPLGGPNVIRWVLNQPGLLGGDKVYPEGEQVFVYSDSFAPYVQNKIQGKLYMTTLDRTIFFPPAQEALRTLECYYVGKSTYRDGYCNPDLALEITRGTPPKTELGKIFRTAKVLYCFDNSTALTYEAIICGCPVVIIPDGTQTWADYQKLELGTQGMSWDGQLNSGPTQPGDSLEERLQKREREYAQELNFLVAHTQRISPAKRIPTLPQSARLVEPGPAKHLHP